MAIKKDSIVKALKLLKIPDDNITQLLDDTEEHDLTIPDDLNVYDAASLTEYTANIKKGLVKQNDAREIFLRKMNTDYELGLTGPDAKDEAKVMAAYKAKLIAEAGATPSEWETKLSALQTTINGKETDILTWKQKAEALENERKYRKLFFANMSDALDEDEWIARFAKNFTIKHSDTDNIEGLWDNAAGKFIMDDKAAILPFKAAWDAIREQGKDTRFKSWFKAETPVVEPAEPKKTHAADRRNPAGPRVQKYTLEQINAMVEKKYPFTDKGKVKGWAANRATYFNELRAMTAA